MSFIDLHLENIKLPKGYEEIILSNNPLTPELSKQGFEKGLAPIYWRTTCEDICLTVTQDQSSDKKGLEYRILLFTSNNSFKEFNSVINEWCKRNKIKGDIGWRWAHWLVQYINEDEELDSITTEENMSVSAPMGENNVYISSTDVDVFNRLRTVISSVLRELANSKFEDIEQAFDDAIVDEQNIEQCIEFIDQNRDELVEYPDLWNKASDILRTHGVTETTVPFLAAMCSIPVKNLRKYLDKLSAPLNIVKLLNEDKELAEDLFYALQTNIQNYYTDQKSGYATKELVKKTAKILAISCQVFGFGIQPSGLTTIIRLFENDVMEGIDLESYRADIIYNAEDYGYYDGEENEPYYDNFWSTIDIQTFFK